MESYFRNISGEEAVRQEMEGSKSRVQICGHCCGQLEPNPSGDCWRWYTIEISKPQPSGQIWHSARFCTPCKHGHHSSILAWEAQRPSLDVSLCPYFSLCSQHLPAQPVASPSSCTGPVPVATFTLGTLLLVTSGHLALESQARCQGIRTSLHLCPATQTEFTKFFRRREGSTGICVFLGEQTELLKG